MDQEKYGEKLLTRKPKTPYSIKIIIIVMKTLVQILVAAVVLLITSVVIVFMFSGEVGDLGKSGDRLVNGTTCDKLEQWEDEGNIDSLPERCQTSYIDDPPETSVF